MALYPNWQENAESLLPECHGAMADEIMHEIYFPFDHAREKIYS